MANELVLTEKIDGGITYITLNRPEKLNSMNAELRQQLMAAVTAAGDDEETRVIILRGAGRAFSSGGGISSNERRTNRGTDTGVERSNLQGGIKDYLTIFDLPKPVIAQVHGYCIGVAFSLCVFCDLVVVAEDTVVGWPGVPTGAGYISPMVYWVMGSRKAREGSYLTGLRFTGKEAADMGWANRAVPADRVEQETLDMARRIAKVPPEIMRLKKEANNKVLEMQGFRNVVQLGAEFDTIAHFTDVARALNLEAAETGYKVLAERYMSP